MRGDADQIVGQADQVGRPHGVFGQKPIARQGCPSSRRRGGACQISFRNWRRAAASAARCAGLSRPFGGSSTSRAPRDQPGQGLAHGRLDGWHRPSWRRPAWAGAARTDRPAVTPGPSAEIAVKQAARYRACGARSKNPISEARLSGASRAADAAVALSAKAARASVGGQAGQQRARPRHSGPCSRARPRPPRPGGPAPARAPDRAASPPADRQSPRPSRCRPPRPARRSVSASAATSSAKPRNATAPRSMSEPPWPGHSTQVQRCGARPAIASATCRASPQSPCWNTSAGPSVPPRMHRQTQPVACQASRSGS